MPSNPLRAALERIARGPDRTFTDLLEAVRFIGAMMHLAEVALAAVQEPVEPVRNTDGGRLHLLRDILNLARGGVATKLARGFSATQAQRTIAEMERFIDQAEDAEIHDKLVASIEDGRNAP